MLCLLFFLCSILDHRRRIEQMKHAQTQCASTSSFVHPPPPHNFLCSSAFGLITASYIPRPLAISRPYFAAVLCSLGAQNMTEAGRGLAPHDPARTAAAKMGCRTTPENHRGLVWKAQGKNTRHITQLFSYMRPRFEQFMTGKRPTYELRRATDTPRATHGQPKGDPQATYG